MNEENEKTDGMNLDDIKSNFRTLSKFCAEHAVALEQTAESRGNAKGEYLAAAEVLKKLSGSLKAITGPECTPTPEDLQTAAAGIGYAANELYQMAQKTNEADFVRAIWQVYDELLDCKESAERRLHRP